MLSPTSPSQLQLMLNDIDKWFMPVATEVSALANALNSPETSNLCAILRSLRKHRDLMDQYDQSNLFPKALRRPYLELYIACMRFMSSVHPLSTPTSEPCSSSRNHNPESSSAPHGSYETRLQIVQVIASMMLDVVMTIPQIEAKIFGAPYNHFWPRSIDDIAQLGAKKLLLSIEKWAMVLPPRPAADLLICYQRLNCFTRGAFDPPLVSSTTIYRTFLAVARQSLDAFKALQLGITTGTPETYARIGASSWALGALGQVIFNLAWNRRDAPWDYHLRLHSIGREYIEMLQTPHFSSDKTIASYPHILTWVHILSFLSNQSLDLEFPPLDPVIMSRVFPPSEPARQLSLRLL